MDTELTPNQADTTPRSRSVPIIERAPLPIVEVQGSVHLVSHVNSAFCLLLGISSRHDPKGLFIRRGHACLQS